MRTIAKRLISRIFVAMLALMLAQAGAFAEDRPFASQQQLDQMLAPIALYPDALLSQILMASTYPLEVVEAARWSQNHPNLAGDDAVRAAANEDWDPSVKSLLAFPQVLARMNENLQWTESLGDAFLDQQPQVMDTVQNLRHRAQEAGNLRSDDRVRVIDSGPYVMLEYANPEIVYVPYYDPMVVYGAWWWPVQPFYWQPWPGYYSRPGFTFYWGAPIGISARFFFGGCDWSRRQVRVVQVNNYYYNNVTVNRQWSGVNRETVVSTVNRGPGLWQHDPAHRRGVAYPSVQLQQRFGATAAPSDASRRDSVRTVPGTAPDRSAGAGGLDMRRPGMRRDADPRANERSERRNDPRGVNGAAIQAVPPPQAAPEMSIDNHERHDRGNRTWSSPQGRGVEAIPERHEPREEFHGRPPEQRHEPAARRETPQVIEGHPRTPQAQPEDGLGRGRRFDPPRPAESRVQPPPVQMPQIPQAQMPRPQAEAPHPAPHAEQHRGQHNDKDKQPADK